MTKQKKVKHGFVLTHPTPKSMLAKCKCGAWTGVYTGNRAHAEKQYRDHVGSADAQARTAKRRGGHAPMPAPVTPVDRLPDGLRG